MSHQVRFVVITLALGLGACKDAASFGSSPPSKPTTGKDCKTELKAGDDARMACILDGNGTTSRVGDVIGFHCPSFDATRSSINGSDPFPVSTSICRAAVYVGKLDPTTGGDVKIEILAAASEYPKGEVKNGVKSQTWSSSTNGTPGYRFVD